MHFSEITPHSFRNLASNPVLLGGGLHVVTGENGQGKTNLLEALALLCAQRSFRRARPSACAPDGQHFCVSGQIEGENQPERLRVEWSRTAGRHFWRGDKSASFQEISETTPAVFLAPEHRELVTGSPEARRRFLDRLVLSSRPAAGADLARYERALAERNALLAPGAGRRAQPEELETWTEELAVAGTAVRKHRVEALSEWRENFEALAREAGSPYGGICVTYPSGDQSLDELRRACEGALPAERRRGHSLCGPHRDDLLWTREGRSFSSEASSGEAHRTAALTKLAEWHTVAGTRGQMPLFGADDFDAGLSRSAVEAFLEALPERAQVLLTTASDPLRWKGRAAIIWMREGRALAPAPPQAASASASGS